MASDRERAKLRARFRNLIDEFQLADRSVRNSVIEASKILGISERTGWRWYSGETRAKNDPDRNRDTEGTDPRNRPSRIRGGVPDPKEYHELSDVAKRMLAPDGYPLFLEKVFGWDLVPWELKAAKVSLEAILDSSERHYGVVNQPPGSGKSSNWTFALPVWLNLGGGFEDPMRGRRLRFQLGHASKEISKMYVQRIARLYDTPRPYFDMKTGRYGDVVIMHEFGRMKPIQARGDVTLWQDKQFIVAQLEDVDLSDKEPTFLSVSPGSEFVGGRCEYANWDDLVTEKLSRTIESVESQSAWFQKEAEQRIEPGGILWLTGQRINSYDLFRDRLDDQWIDDAGDIHPKYFHIVFPVHHEPTCDGNHRQWDAEPDGDGCLLDAVRLPWQDILKVANTPHFRTVFQQEDTDPKVSLVTMPMLDGGTAYETDPVTGKPGPVEYPGCWDHRRGFGDFPARVDGLINYVTVDPAAGGKNPKSNWAIEWWATTGVADTRYLIWAARLQMQAGDLLDWDERSDEFIGWMEKLQASSTAGGQPIRVWVIESNAFFKHFYSYRHYRRWRQKWPFVQVIPHETQKNKRDPVMGVDALIRAKYRGGQASLPRKKGDLRALTFMNAFAKELTTYPRGATDDTVLADWFGEANIESIVRFGRKPIRDFEVDAKIPPYLVARRREIPVRRA